MKYNYLYVHRLNPQQEWPPSAGATFDTSVLMWSFQDAAFWRGKHVAMAEIIGIARAIAVTRFREATSQLIQKEFGGFSTLGLFFSQFQGGSWNPRRNPLTLPLKSLADYLTEVVGETPTPEHGINNWHNSQNIKIIWGLFSCLSGVGVWLTTSLR